MFIKFVALILFFSAMANASVAIADDTSIQSSVGSMIEIGTGVSAPVGSQDNSEISLLMHVSLGRVHRNGESRRISAPLGRIVGRISADVAVNPGVSGDPSLSWLEVEVIPVTRSVVDFEREQGFMSLTTVIGVTHVSSQIDLGNRYYASFELIGFALGRGYVLSQMNRGQLQVVFDAMVTTLGAGWGRLTETYDIEAGGETYRISDDNRAGLLGFTSRGSGRMLFSFLFKNHTRITLSQNASFRISVAGLNGEALSTGNNYASQTVRLESNLATRLEVHFRRAWNLFVEYRRQGIRLSNFDSPTGATQDTFDRNSGFERHQHQLMGGVLYVY